MIRDRGEVIFMEDKFVRTEAICFFGNWVLAI